MRGLIGLTNSGIKSICKDVRRQGENGGKIKIISLESIFKGKEN